MLERLIHDFLKELGEDPEREGLERTPARVAKAFKYFTSGYGQDAHPVLNDALFTEEYDEMAVVKDMDLKPLRAGRQIVNTVAAPGARATSIQATVCGSRSRIHEDTVVTRVTCEDA